MLDNKTMIILVAVIAVAAVGVGAYAITNSNDDTKDAVMYYGNGGTYDGQSQLKSTLLTVQNCPFTKSGATFIGWDTKADGSGTSYAVGSEVKLGTKLYAQWNDSAYFSTVIIGNDHPDIVSMYLESADGSNSVCIDESGKYKIPANPVLVMKPKVAGTSYSLGGKLYFDDGTKGYELCTALNDASTDSVSVSDNKCVLRFTPKSNFVNASTNLVYEWNAVHYWRNYDEDDSTKTSDTSNYALPGDTFEAPTDKHFVEWNTKEDGSGAHIAPGTEIPRGLSLKAIWAND